MILVESKIFGNQPAGPRGPIRDLDSTPSLLNLRLDQYHILRMNKGILKANPGNSSFFHGYMDSIWYLKVHNYWFTWEASQARQDPWQTKTLSKGTLKRHWLKCLCHVNIIIQVPSSTKPDIVLPSHKWPYILSANHRIHSTEWRDL